MIKIIEKIDELRKILKEYRRNNQTIGFVPTMGYLHEGHASLIKRSSSENEITIVSIFVNPIQFGPNEDLDKYPRDLERDKKVAFENGADIIFHPKVNEMYPEKLYTFVNVENLDKELCGAKREGHFKGVATVVTKLFNIVNPDKAYFGKKDAQQLAIIKKMVKDMNFDIEIIGCDIIREKDGLAKSSRNSYLKPKERKAATILKKTLDKIKEMLDNKETDVKKIINLAIKNIEKEPLAKIDYVEIVDLYTLEKVNKIETDVLVAMAVYIGKTRLIDNFDYKFN
ncbi:pantothenate synthetase [Hypnocyclicus thermotrophus]|uniref:Pantothenate synthetase n=1 Tax=Hypnocyclicus thermotrophus TaxID=1627895 RepID=A0AA46DXT3_9FUSO|nr:pantothenate synthetase [Hypnocyclicus thermotrophus]